MRELLSRVQKEWQKEAPELATPEPTASSPLLCLTARCAVTSPRGIACLLDDKLAGERGVAKRCGWQRMSALRSLS